MAEGWLDAVTDATIWERLTGEDVDGPVPLRIEVDGRLSAVLPGRETTSSMARRRGRRWPSTAPTPTPTTPAAPSNSG